MKNLQIGLAPFLSKKIFFTLFLFLFHSGLVQSVAENERRVINVIDVSTNVLKRTDWRLAKQVEITGYGSSIFVNPLDNLKGAIREIKEVLKDGDGRVIQDAEGNSLIIVEDEFGKSAYAVLKNNLNVLEDFMSNPDKYDDILTKEENLLTEQERLIKQAFEEADDFDVNACQRDQKYKQYYEQKYGGKAKPKRSFETEYWTGVS